MTDSRSQYKSFSPQAYMQSFCSSMGDPNPLIKGDLFTWFADRNNEIWDTGMIGKGHVLDIGTGPNIHSAVSATRHCESIILSDFTPQNRDFLASWLYGSSPWKFSPIFDYVTTIEGKGELASVRESNMKQKIRAILPVDLLEDEPFAPCYLPKADVITSSLCLESAALEYSEYKKVVNRTMSLLKEDGHLVLNGVLSCSLYFVGGVPIKICFLNSEEIKAAWTECGLKIITWKEEEKPPNDEDNSAGVFVMHGQKMT